MDKLIISEERIEASNWSHGQIDCNVGVVQRAERIVLLGFPMVFLGAGRNGMLLLGIVSVLALFAVITVVQRVHHVYKLTRSPLQESMPREPVAALADSMEKGQSGD